MTVKKVAAVSLNLLVSLIFSCSVLAAPAGSSCSAVFPNGASSHSANGYIDIGYNAQVLGTSNHVLATSTITRNDGSNKKTCQNKDCSASGAPSDSMNVGDFVSKSSTTDIVIDFQGEATVGDGSNPGNTFDDINPHYASEATITFSNKHSEYFVDSLILAFQNTLYLQAGSTYWINQLVTSSQAEIIVQGSGTAIVYVNQSIAFPSPGFINSPVDKSSGDASKLVLYAYNDVSFNNQTIFSGSLYAKGNVTLGSASYAFGAITAANITLGSDSTITYQASSIANTSYGEMCAAVTVGVDHFRIEHDNDTQGFTCEAETVTVKACADATCANLYTQPTSITLAPSGWSGGNTFTFTGSVSKNLSQTTPGIYTYSKTASSETVDLKCFIGDSTGRTVSDTCNVEFVDAGFEFIGATVNDKTLPDQIAETNFNNVQLRAVYNDNGVCGAALVGSQSITFAYDCIDRDTCLTTLAGIPANNPQGENSGTLNVTFDNKGIAPLSSLNYADAGRINLSAQATINDAQILKGTAGLVVYPDYLQVNVSPTSLISTGATDNATITAGKIFEWQVSAHGKAGRLLLNYQPGDIKLRVLRISPIATGSAEGQFEFAPYSRVNSSTNSTIYSDVSLPDFTEGSYRYNAAYYSETGRISLDVQDANYFGNKICTLTDCGSMAVNEVVLDRFIPAYYLVEEASQPTLQDVIVNTNVADSFTYVGQTNTFAINPELKVTAKNALGQTTFNSDSGLASVGGEWALEPSSDDVKDNLEYLDSSDYATVGTAKAFKGTAPTFDGLGNFDGSVLIEIKDATVTYNKVVSNVDNTMYGPVKPFAASVDIIFTAPFFTDSDGVCFRTAYTDPSCSDFRFSGAKAVKGANLRFGRFALKSTYGPETEPLTAGFAAEYYLDGRWLTNTADNWTAINFEENNSDTGTLILCQKGDSDIRSLISPVSSDNTLLLGVPDSSTDFYFNAPGRAGEVYLRLNPAADLSGWPQYLNYDWNDDGVISNEVPECPDGPDDDNLPNKTDFPQATISFGLFRGNDRVIQWREVFN
jgi:MSHA biogenesis protein MshQ